MEQPPNSTSPELKEYLYRQLTSLEYDINDLGRLPMLTTLPTKPKVGKVYYFKNTISPTITVEGVWTYKSSGWALLG